MVELKKEIISRVESCTSITKVFGQSFLTGAIQSYKVINSEWSRENYFIANYLMSSSYYWYLQNCITELEDMLKYFLSNHTEYIKSKSVLKRLKSKDEPLFQGIWSELIFTNFLRKRDIKIVEVSKTVRTKNGEVELFDIKTNYGEIEVTTIMSSRGRIFEEQNTFSGSLEIGNIEKKLVNKKIKDKSGKKIVAIDCTFVEGLYLNLVEGKEGLPIDFNVFRHTSKNIFLFIRVPETQQVGLTKYLVQNHI